MDAELEDSDEEDGGEERQGGDDAESAGDSSGREFSTGGDTRPSSPSVMKVSTSGKMQSQQPLSQSSMFSSAATTAERVLFEAYVEVILPSSNSTHPASRGILEVTKSKISFTLASTADPQKLESLIAASGTFTTSVIPVMQKRAESAACDQLWACLPFPSTVWATSELVDILQRYYQLRFVAVEIFTTSRKTFFFNLFDQKIASNFQQIIRRVVKPPLLLPFLGKRPPTIMLRTTKSPFSTQHITLAWANREITNFEYLMKLNTIAGRTFNDLGQYPIFPWIIADYTSEVLDLKNPATFRDLRWPIGAQNAKQRQMLMSKYADLKMAYDLGMEEDLGGDDCGGGGSVMLPPFNYGTHYSVAGFVLWFLMRLEPYTSLHVQLQDGRIDRPDRLFDSFEAAYKGCTSNPSDVKELIPELFYCPDILRNMNDVDFGTTQTHKKIDHVKLPRWAKDPHDFIFKHREALESEYVSMNLHHWIDLIFGYKQRPPHLNGDEAAVEACNVFFHLTYEDAVDLESLRKNNQFLYEQYLCQISEFGQIPCQLFTTKHVRRAQIQHVDLIWPIASILPGIHTMRSSEESPGRPRKVFCFKEVQVSVHPILLIAECSSRLVTVDLARVLGYHAWQVLKPDVVPPFKISVDSGAYEFSKGYVTKIPNSTLNCLFVFVLV